MNGLPEMVTVYRSMDNSAAQDCEAIADLLTAEGLSPVILDDNAPGVPEGTYEVRVPADQQEEAERSIANHPVPGDVEDEVGDPSSYLDMSHAVFHSEGSTTAEFEAMEIKQFLEASGIQAVIVGDSVLPNFPFEVRVTEEDAERARQVIEDHLKGGAEAAEQAERETEPAQRIGEP